MTELIQVMTNVALVVFGGGAFWGYLNERKKAKAEGTVAAATVEIQVESSRVQSLEQRFAFAQKAWDEERASLTRRINHLEEELEEERKDAAAEKARNEAHIRELEGRVARVQAELQAVNAELTVFRERNGLG